jgi:3-oxoacyl-(acyl-carrier-protein) synthase
MRKKVVVTGCDMITALGLDLSTTWNGMLKSENGTARITRFDASAR